jgi:hypothetical protein
MRGTQLAVTLLLLTVFVTPASAQAPQQWDGSNPFTCTLQNAASLQDPNADPFCVEYDHSGIDATAIQQLLSDGPNQLAAVAGKCFLYRVDRFTSALGEVDTAMFANKATGTGGSAITNATVPIPATGGMTTVPVVQSCTGQTQTGTGGGGTTGGGFLGGVNAPPNPGVQSHSGPQCKNLRGNAKSGLGRARLGMNRAAVRHRFGKPTRRASGYFHYCLSREATLPSTSAATAGSTW